MRTTWLFLLVLLTLALVSALPRRGWSSSRGSSGSSSRGSSGSSSRGSSGSRGSSSRGSSGSSGSRGSSSRGSSGSRGSSSSRGSKWGGGSKVTQDQSKVKAKNFKNVKKVALVAAGTYVGYKLAKLGTKFAIWSHGGSWGFDDWDDWREADGMLCRTSNDCQWIDRNMRCEDWEVRKTGFSSGWFGGVSTSTIHGECACPEGTFFDDDDMNCKNLWIASYDSQEYALGILTIFGIIVAVIFAIGCILILRREYNKYY